MSIRTIAIGSGLVLTCGALLLGQSRQAAPSPPPASSRVFVPVSDATLQKPDPSDWVNWRRTLDAWGYSPLEQINRSNVRQLQLAWSWALPPAGRPEPNPLIYKGVMYVASPFGVVEALDAASGDLMWQYRYDVDA